jgi:ParB-like chromosome segregation protein Spo0J
MTQRTAVDKPVADLRPHPDNVRIYGVIDEKTLDKEFLESVRTKGVLEPITATETGEIISGNRRWLAAKLTGQPIVPSYTLPADTDELEIKELLVHYNYQRERDNRIKAREAVYLAEVEYERAARRQRESTSRAGKASGAARRGETNAETPVSPRSEDAGKTRKKVAEQLKVGEVTAERLITVGKAIKEAEERDDAETVKHLEETVDRSVKAAADEVKGKTASRSKQKRQRRRHDTPVLPLPTEQEVRETLGGFDDVENDLAMIRAKLRDLAKRRGGEDLRWYIAEGPGGQTIKELDTAIKIVKGCRPVAVGCQKCHGVRDKLKQICDECGDHGYVCKLTWDKRMSKQQQEKYQPLEPMAKPDEPPAKPWPAPQRTEPQTRSRPISREAPRRSKRRGRQRNKTLPAA